jgi:Eco29kI restriction endonuclease
MASRNSKSAAGVPSGSTSYDPLDLKTLAESMARVVLEQPVHPLAKVPVFEGAGVYIIYYTGSYEPYKSIAQKNKGQKWEQPIYVGEAARKGGRKGGVLLEGPAGKVLFNRLKNHLDSIRNTKNLRVDDFWCRYLAIDRYTPIWNKVIDGFGNKVVGAGRENEQQKSMWDVVHPGRTGAAAKTNKKYPNDEAVLEKLRKFYAGKPVKLIPTTDAVADAEKGGESKD